MPRPRRSRPATGKPAPRKRGKTSKMGKPSRAQKLPPKTAKRQAYKKKWDSTARKPTRKAPTRRRAPRRR